MPWSPAAGVMTILLKRLIMKAILADAEIRRIKVDPRLNYLSKMLCRNAAHLTCTLYAQYAILQTSAGCVDHNCLHMPRANEIVSKCQPYFTRTKKSFRVGILPNIGIAARKMVYFTTAGQGSSNPVGCKSFLGLLGYLILSAFSITLQSESTQMCSYLVIWAMKVDLHFL